MVLSTNNSLPQRRPRLRLVFHWRSIPILGILTDSAIRVLKLLVIPSSDLLHSSLAIQPLSNGFIGLHKLVKLFGKLLILHSDHPNVVIKGINLYLQIRIIV